MTVNEKWKLLFDGECETCRRFSEMVIRFDTENLIHVVSLQEHFQLNREIPLEELREELHLLSVSGKVLRGGEAIAMIISLVPATRPFRWMVENPLGRRGSSAVYRMMKRMRRCRSCR